MASTYTIDRSITVNATPAAIYPYLADFHQWIKWSPFDSPELEMNREYTGSPSGQGAEFSWLVPANGASGKMAMLAAAEPSSGQVRIDFLTPNDITIEIGFVLVDQGADTEVRWSLEGKHTLMTRAAKATGMLNKFGKQELDRGLAQLKAVVEAGA
ncbi:SRPBCC family protein [Gordonia sp. TBRC 11910]|uniref:SRPBCC family protein n=1 Tax=Gordonia asplenii TaxID=2725283 RepID=A0A848KRF3_9ACTN|nr:SRPBCC family protein [Gordonia asplenii]NMO00507.1 SRPBCC family protein [Gordonia asplenii]